MYRTRIRNWGLDKKSKEHEMKALAYIYRQESGCVGSSIVRIRNRRYGLKDVARYWARKGLSVDEVDIGNIVDRVQTVANQGTSGTSLRLVVPPEDLVKVERLFCYVREYRGHFSREGEENVSQ